MSIENTKGFEQALASVKSDSPARQRIEKLFDEGSFVELDAFLLSADKPAGVITGYGSVDGALAYAFSQDATCDKGAVNSANIKKIQKVYDLALKTGAPVVGFFDSNGVKLDDYNSSLKDYGEWLKASAGMSGVAPQIAVIAGVCAGVGAMIATGFDIVVMTEKAELFVSAANSDGSDFATAQFAAAAGVAHIVAKDDAEAAQTARQLVSQLPANNLSGPVFTEFDADAAAQAKLEALSTTAADGKEIAGLVADNGSIIELQQDFGAGVYTALCSIGGMSAGIVANCGEYLDKDQLAKASRFVSFCDAFSLPLVTFVNSKGISLAQGAERSGGIRAGAKLAHVYAEATTPKIAVITGYAVGPAYIALAGKPAADLAFAWPQAVVGTLETKTAVAMLYADRITAENPREKAEKAYEENEASALSAAQNGLVDGIISRGDTRKALIEALDTLSSKRVERLPKKHSNAQF